MCKTMDEVFKKREQLVAQQRQLRQAVKILNSDTFPANKGVEYAKTTYDEQIKNIDRELMDLAEEAKRIQSEVAAKQQEAPKPETDNTEWTIEFDFEGTKTYPTNIALMHENKVEKSKVLTWKDKDAAEAFARWYAYKHGYRVVPVSEIK